MEPEAYCLVRDRLRERGVTVLDVAGIDAPEGCGHVVFAWEGGGAEAILDLVQALSPRLVLMNDGLHGTFALHFVSDLWLEVVVMTEEANAALAQLEVESDLTDRAMESLADEVLEVIASLPVSRHGRSTSDIVSDVIAGMPSNPLLTDDAIQRVKNSMRSGAWFWYDELQRRHADWVREHATDLASRVLEDHPQPAGRVSKTLQRQLVREWMKDLDPACSTLAVIEPVVVALGELLAEHSRDASL